ncbi:DEAD/DEAH box helicase family protein [Sporolactobacillus putidus]|uniref:Helicase/UvrB N-terminal domain-containing protein n=1 Tax=Sporolactobacillus putidus TaxID=492735 RepID=A0A917S9K5_9BACL|nr:DEAD/DEAH box helicase family protein [Sporolactobacillus putidus]GGL63010.1 hypothetical protein GCM10007968_28670 [Sporolactobacillus putidus]
MELIPFQIEASSKIADRFKDYMMDPLTVTRTQLVPFYQNLSSITGSGKTLILADALQQIRSSLSVEPIVLWLSKGKVVVWQTYNNLSTGKYADLIDNSKVKPILDATEKDIEVADSTLLLIATVGKFNQKDKEQGDRKIFQVQLDQAEKSLWDMLKKRKTVEGIKRDLIVVYDEGHNLSDQQTELLLDLDPDALIAASATVRVPKKLSNTIERLSKDKGWVDSDFTTQVKSSDVVESGLIKKNLLIGGYLSPTEVTLDDMIVSFKKLESDCDYLNTPFKPKAIYVTNTNVITGAEKDDVKQPFIDRKARPIIIWRYLVEQKGIDPKEIAVYCDLKFDKKFPPPEDFVLFSGGDSDYTNFVNGNFRHIIFNQTLQEGWDDPSVYFAYIDKDMGSNIQVTQIIGRVLRQPTATHFPLESLNTANFFIRTDEKSTFENELLEIQQKITADSPEIKLTYYSSGKGLTERPLLKPKYKLSIPEFSVYSQKAKTYIDDIIKQMNDYSVDSINTVGTGGRIQVLKTIGDEKDSKEEWVEIQHSNKVAARWIFAREIQKSHRHALNICDIELSKFDALVEYSSNAAAHIKDTANKVIKAYVEHSNIIQNNLNCSFVSEIPINRDKMIKFNNAVHEGYSDFNGMEIDFAKAIDRTGYKWLRNPSRAYFQIPLLDFSNKKNFNPDFVIWTKDDICALDTKGEHLIAQDSTNKLFNLDTIGDGKKVKIRLITKGEWRDPHTPLSNKGYSVWMLKMGKIESTWSPTVDDSIRVALDNNVPS